MSRKKLPAAKGGQAASRVDLSRLPWLAPAALLVLTALVYARSLAVPILDWDDNIYWFRDARLDHLSADNLWRILTQPFFANFHPITTLTLAFDRAVWGTWVPGFHVTQLAFYVGGVLGLYFLFARVLESHAAAFAAAAIYAVHTLHVESVAWLAARKDVVCLFFYSFALLSYVRYASSPKKASGAYAVCVILTAAAMLSKGYAVILPAAFLAYDLCFHRRLTRRNFVDKIPFLALSVATTILTVHAQDRSTALVQSTLTGSARAALLASIFAQYVGRSVLPVGLSPFYKVASEPVEGFTVLLGCLLALGFVAGFFFWRWRLPAVAFGIALFLLPLATVMNVAFTLRIWMADRYVFLPTIGSCLALVALVGSLSRQRTRISRSLRRGLAVFAGLAIILYSALTVARISVWTSRASLWSDALRQQLRLGGSGTLTAGELSRATSLRPVSRVVLNNLVQAYADAGKGPEAERIAGLLEPSAVGGAEEREMALAHKDLDAGRLEEALRRFRAVAEGGSWMAPTAMVEVGVVENRMGNVEASRQALQRAIELYRKTGQPATDALFSLGAMEFNRGNFPKAAEWYRLARRESPLEAKPAFYLARALEESGNLAEATQLYEQITSGKLPISSGSQFTMPDVYFQLSAVAEKLGRPQKAIGYLEEVLRRWPDHPRKADILARIAALKGG